MPVKITNNPWVLSAAFPFFLAFISCAVDIYPCPHLHDPLVHINPSDKQTKQKKKELLTSCTIDALG